MSSGREEDGSGKQLLPRLTRNVHVKTASTQQQKCEIISPNRSLSSTEDASKRPRRLTRRFLWFAVIFFLYRWSRWRDHLLPLFLGLGISLFLRVILILREIGQALVHLAVLHLQQVCTIKAKLTSALICRFAPVISSNL